MSIEIITIGREILDGRVVDTNSAFFGQELSKIGQVPRHFQRVDDIEADIIAAFELAASRSRYVLVSGGLGPTSDDMTAAVFAKFAGQAFIENPVAREMVKSTFEKMKRPIIDTQWKQARMAEGAMPLANPHGTAPGFKCDYRGVQWFFVPGVPREMKPMFLNHVLGQIPCDEHFEKKMWITHFTSEGELQQRLGPVIAALPAEISFFYRTRFPENHLGISGSLKTKALKGTFAAASKRIEDLLGADIFSSDDTLSLEAVVNRLAVEKHCHLVSVESCTGGLVASRLTDTAGSSASFWSGFITYDNHVKEWLAESVGLGDKMRRALSEHGAVSLETAAVMAEAGAKVYLKKNITPAVLCVSTTGIAGPDGGTAEKPVGMCCIAISDGQSILQTFQVRARLGLERDQLKLLFSQHALERLRQQLIT